MEQELLCLKVQLLFSKMILVMLLLLLICNIEKGNNSTKKNKVTELLRYS